MPGTLYIVATPIGNLEDITLRALRVLREVDLIAAEDTRRTAGLLARHAIDTPTISFHQHNTRARLPQLLARLAAGESMALVTDAGTPGISDPGAELVQASVDRGVPVDPVPGVSAPIAAAVASGFPLTPLTVCGFPPSRSKDRSVWFSTLSAIEHTVTFFEAPHRIAATLAAAADKLGTRQIVVARELTKVHQQFLRGTASEVAEQLPSTPKGEFTVVIGPMMKVETEIPTLSDSEIVVFFGQMTQVVGGSRRAAIRATARELGISSNAVYDAIERAKNRS